MAKKRTGSGKQKTKPPRRPGRPKRSEPVVTPALIEEISRQWLQGASLSTIAGVVGIDRTTVRYHIDNTIRPQWIEDGRSRLVEDLAKVAHLERTAWERFHANSPGETVEQIEQGLLEGGNKLRIVKKATRTVTKTGEAAWLDIVRWCIEFRAKIFAHYAPTRHHVDHGGELRVAGKTPAQVDQEMLKRLFEQIEERRKYRESLDFGEN